MRVLFTTQPAIGHFRPLVSFARALLAANHEVAVACAPAFRGEVESEGLTCFAAGLDYLVGDVTRAFPDMPPPGPERPKRMLHLWRGDAAVAMATDLLQIAKTWSPDLIVHEGTEFGACLAAERLGICNAAAGALWFRADDTSPLDSAIAAIGCSSRPALYDHLALAAMPPSWIAPGDQVPKTVHFVNPALEGMAGPPLPWLDVLPSGRPLVHATMGTTEVNRTPGVYESIIDALRDEPVNLVVATGNDRSASSFFELPPHIRIERHVPHASLLPRCSVVVTHGGHGTLMASLALGIPVVVIPVNADQPRNADRCEALGVGCVVRPGERRPDVIRAAVRRVLDDPSYRDNAIRLGGEISSLPRNTVVRLLEEKCR